MPRHFPWDATSTDHLVYRMSDAELLQAIDEALSTPRTIHYVHMVRIATQRRRDDLSFEDNMRALEIIGRAEGRSK